MARYRLLRGVHSRREGGDRKHRTYSAGDEIELNEKEIAKLRGRIQRIGVAPKTLTTTPPAPLDDGGEDNFVSEEDIARELAGRGDNGRQVVGTDDGDIVIPSGDEVDAKEREAAEALAAAAGGEGDKAATQGDEKPVDPKPASPLEAALAQNSQARTGGQQQKRGNQPHSKNRRGR